MTLLSRFMALSILSLYNDSVTPAYWIVAILIKSGLDTQSLILFGSISTKISYQLLRMKCPFSEFLFQLGRSGMLVTVPIRMRSAQNLDRSRNSTWS